MPRRPSIWQGVPSTKLVSLWALLLSRWFHRQLAKPALEHTIGTEGRRVSCNAECAPPSSRLLNPPQSSAHSPSDHPPLAACRHFPWPARCLLFALPVMAQRPVAETSPGLPRCGNLLLCPSRPAIAIDKPLSTSSTAPPQAYGARAASRPSGGARRWRWPLNRSHDTKIRGRRRQEEQEEGASKKQNLPVMTGHTTPCQCAAVLGPLLLAKPVAP